MSDMWTEATRDFEREASERALVQARIATAHLWPFFASAVSEADFDNRIALSEDRLTEAVSDDTTRTRLVESYRKDFLLLAERQAALKSSAKTAASGYVLVDESKFSPEMHKRFIGYFDSEAEAKAWAEKEYGVPSDVWGDRVYVKDVGGSPETEASRKAAGLGDGLPPGKYWAVSPNRDGENYEYFSSEEEARAAFPDQYPVPINIQDTPEMTEDQKQFLDWMGASRKTAATKKVRDLQPGDMLDLSGDQYADDGSDDTLEYEYAAVSSIEQETPDVTVVHFENYVSVGFPPDHEVKIARKISRLSEEELDKIEFGRDEAVCRECGKVIPVNQMSSHAETHGLNSDGTEKESKKTAAEQKTKRVYQTVSVGETPDKAAMVALTMACGYGWEKNLDQIDIQVEQRGTSVLDGKPIWGVLLTGPAEVFRSGIRGERLPDDWGQKTAAGSKTASRAWNEEAVAQAMAETLVWTGSDWHNMEEGEVNPLSLDEAGYSTDDISPEGWATLRDEARQFIQGEAELLDLLPDWYGEEQLGHDIILTRQGHGTGFWDRGLGDLGNKLTDACRPYGDIDIFAQNGRLYVEGKKVAKRGSFRFRTARKVLATRTSQQLLDGTLLDPPAANSLVNLYRSLSAKNRQRFDAVPLGDLLELSKQARPQVKTSAKLRKKANAIEVSVCVDCAMFAANGELPDPEYRDPDEFVQSFNHYTEGMILVIEDGETHFSWSSCDTCGSTLGGDRFDAVLVDR